MDAVTGIGRVRMDSVLYNTPIFLVYYPFWVNESQFLPYIRSTNVWGKAKLKRPLAPPCRLVECGLVGGGLEAPLQLLVHCCLPTIPRGAQITQLTPGRELSVARVGLSVVMLSSIDFEIRCCAIWADWFTVWHTLSNEV